MQICLIHPPPLYFIWLISNLFGFSVTQFLVQNLYSTRAFPQQCNNCNWSPVAFESLACSSINTTTELPGCCPWCWSVNDGFVMEDASMLLSPLSHTPLYTLYFLLCRAQLLFWNTQRRVTQASWNVLFKVIKWEKASLTWRWSTNMVNKNDCGVRTKKKHTFM